MSNPVSGRGDANIAIALKIVLHTTTSIVEGFILDDSSMWITCDVNFTQGRNSGDYYCGCIKISHSTVFIVKQYKTGYRTPVALKLS